MPTVCKITLDAAEYKKELNDVVARSKAAQTELSKGSMPGTQGAQTVEIKAESDVPAVAQEAKNVLDGISDKTVNVTVETDRQTLDYIPPSLRKAERSAQAAGKAANQLGGEISKAGGIMSAFGSQAGGKFSGLGQVIGALGSPIVMITAALGSLAAVTMDFLSRGRKAAEELAEITGRNSAAIREAAEATEQQRQKNEANWKSLKSLKESLDTLSITEKASNAQKTEAVRLIGLLSKSYGNLGISIDEATGKIIGYDKAYASVLEKDRKRRLAAINAEMKNNRSEIDQREAQRDSAGVSGWWLLGLPQLLRWNKNTRIGGAEEVEKQNARIEELNKLNQELNAERVRLEKSNPGKDYTTAAKSAELDRKQNTFDSAHDQLKNEEQQLKYQQLINEGRVKEANALKLINDAKKQGMELEKSDAEWIAERQGKVRMDSYYENEMDSLATKKREQELINAGLDEEAEKLRVIMELEKQGAEVSDDKVDKIMRERRELKSLQLAGNLKEQAYGLQNQAMHKVGLGKEADEQKALRDAEKQKGAKLDENEMALVKSIADLTYKMGHETLPQLGDLSVKTNALTSRGGFASGAVMPDKDAVNKAIAKYNETQCQLLEKIKALTEKLNTTVEKSGKV